MAVGLVEPIAAPDRRSAVPLYKALFYGEA
jgi:hypothetical protein